MERLAGSIPGVTLAQQEEPALGSARASAGGSPESATSSIKPAEGCCMKRTMLDFAPGVTTEFADRSRALAQVEEWAEKSTWWPVVIFDPEGCGKTAFLRQASAMLKEAGFDVLYLHPLDRVFNAEVEDQDVKTAFLNLVKQSLEDERWGRLALAVFDLARKLLEKRRRKVAVVADDIFQAIGLDKAAMYVKGLLNMIEHPEHKYEKL